MEWHMNDLSLNGQFPTMLELKESLEPLLALRSQNEGFRKQFFISRTLGNQPATPNQSLFTAIQTSENMDFKRTAISWLSQGPFWNDDRCLHQDDYFEFEGDDVTEQGLGEASRRQIIGIDVHAFSMINSEKNCERTPLRVQHGLTGEVYRHYEIQNIWDIVELEGTINASRPEPQNWDEFFDQVKSEFSEDLLFSENAIEKLRPIPFQVAAKEKAVSLLRTLATLARERDCLGAWTQKGRQVHDTYFTGDNPQFVNEQDPNGKLVFNDPEDTSKMLHCSWHGRMPSIVGRLHFAWPISGTQRKIKVVYIGPKITKT